MNLWSATDIEYDALRGCDHLVVRIFGNSEGKIGKNAFNYCSELKQILLSPTVKVIEEGAFQGCYNLIEVRLSEGLEEISRPK